MRAFHKLFLVLSLVVLEKVNLCNSQIGVFQCQFVEDVYNLMDRKEGVYASDNYHFDCWKSHLTDTSRYKLYTFFDYYRATIADASCYLCKKLNLPKYQNVFRMNYHWIPEYIAGYFQLHQGYLEEYSKVLDGEARDNLFSDMLKLSPDKGSLTDYDEYRYHIISFPVQSTRDYTQHDVIEKYIEDFQNRENFTTKEGIFSYMSPKSTYFGCYFRYNQGPYELNATDALIMHRLTCAFATRALSKSQLLPEEGMISQESCRNATPSGILRQVENKLYICVDLKYEKEDHTRDWPCQFNYPVKKEVFGDSRVCEGNKDSHDYDSLALPDNSFHDIRIHVKNKDSGLWNDSILLKGPTPEPPDFCTAGIHQNYRLIPKYLVNCLTTFGTFLTACAISFASVFLLSIILNAFFSANPLTTDVETG